MADFAEAYRKGQYDRTRGRLRHWLGGFAARRIAKQLAQRGKRIKPITGVGKTAILEGVPDPEGPDEFWEEEWERHVLTICKAQTRQEFGDQFFEAFLG